MSLRTYIQNLYTWLFFIDIYWMVNTDRFHQDFRDSLMISGIERKIGTNAGECMKYILQQMYVCTQPWLSYSNPISFVDIKHLVEAKSMNTEMIKFLDQYLAILCNNINCFLFLLGTLLVLFFSG